ncbi:MAG: hypothetical protein CMJ90_13405 [Planctomycetes bacterium]|nr:hypothetical protein [Planctomycetota bacterium]
MMEVRNRSRLTGAAYRVIRDAIVGLERIEDLHSGGSTIRPQFEIVRSIAYEDGTHDLIVASPSIHMSIAVTCDGELLSATLWNRNPTDDDVVLDRLEGLNPGAVRQDARRECRIGGHTARVNVS